MKKILLPLCCMLFTITLLANKPKVILFPNGNIHFEYEVKNDLFNGAFTSYYENGSVRMKGSFKNNQKNGIWTTWDENCVMRSQRKYTDDYTFEIISEWDAKGVAIAPEIIQQKNERIIGARSKGIISKQSTYMQRFWKNIPADNASNDFLFKDNLFFNFLITAAADKKMHVYEDDRFVQTASDIKQLVTYKQATAVEYLVKEDLTYTRDHEVMHVHVLGICPIVIVNGEKKQVGWFYIPDVRNNRQATDQIEFIITRLEKHNYAGTVTKIADNEAPKGYKEVVPVDSDAITLNTLDFEARIWIYFIENGFMSTK